MEQHNPELTYASDCPYIDLLWQGRIFLSNAVFKLIGKPSGIRFLWNVEKHILIIQPTDINDTDGFPVIGRDYVKNGSLCIGSITLINEIWSAMSDWDKTLRYRTVAKYNVQSNVAIFELKNAVASEIPRNVRGGRQNQKGRKKRI